MTEPEHKPQGPRAQAARQEILSAAARMMRQQGYDGMSLRELASEVGMKAGSLYYHFPSKEALATEVMRLGVDLVREAVGDALSAAPEAAPRARLLIAMEAHLETLLSVSDFTSAHIRCSPFVPAPVRAELTLARKAYDQEWNALIGAALGTPPEAAEVRHLRHALLGALNWSLEWFDPARDSAAEYIASLERLLPQE